MIVSTPGALPLLSLFFVIVTEKTLVNALGNTCFPVPLADPHSIVSPSEKRFHPLSDKTLCSLPLLLLCEDVIIVCNTTNFIENSVYTQSTHNLLLNMHRLY